MLKILSLILERVRTNSNHNSITKHNFLPPKTMKLLIALILFASCSVTRTGTQTFKVTDVKKVANNNSVVKLKGMQGWYVLPSDTLKQGDNISVTWIHKTSR